MVTPSEQVEFRYDDWSAVLARIDGLSASRQGWVNLLPEVTPDEDVSPRSRLGSLFSSAGPLVPMATWVAATGTRPASAGIQHGVGAKVVARLRDHGVAPPSGSAVVQDHGRRGLVLRLADDTDADVVVAWLMDAVDDLCPVQLTGRWLAEIHRG